ncbi:MAG TPA: RNA polymerase sigma factor RpoD/SigA [Candidatus Marinimicrobia bacterium]|nr:RNA polymerase sigma factor RpoD/SigA [Candidatus Neomarinimicrobiota bacterium]MDP7217291.1 RNA polymerase sigma factor RpoD/SigA [Candidatus Neomarinimicrobiota bacterium]MDP7437024.1 RNA polymerase sigma factor RpoD/SigA [Candidatus Neomarinimicrobiota bacterium]HBN44882.1 RNA polymerase subunit sigma [Candidatus Neomarinimicrobiota bacterium]HJL74062.1 RNA polymerase sigma factor RpoD/SigA [Candidatus Neomarinimicrobiota bacterium]
MTKPSPPTGRRALDLYLKEIKKLEPLPPKEEVVLAQRAKTGDTDAFQKLVTHNLRFVVAMAKKFQGQGVPFEDLINEGNLGLIRAVNTFDETRGFKFISYAVWWITQRIRTAIQKTGRTVRLPSHITESMGKLYRQSLELEQEFEREPTTEELAEITDTTIKWIEDLVKAYTGPVSLEDSSEIDRPLIEYLTSKDPRPEMQLMQESLKNEIIMLINTLKEREAQVLTEYYGLGEDDSKTLEQIGKRLGLSSERIRQIKERALQRLRKSTTSQLLKLYLG